jgi:uncharacterized protein involved in exopolysaccharide biosynthesis
VKIVFRRKWFIIIPAVLGLIGGLLAANFLPKLYESSTLILVEEGRVMSPLVQGLAVTTSVAQRLNVLREQILGWDRLIQLIRALDLAKDVKTQLQFEGLIKRLRKNIKVDLRGDKIISISYAGRDPAQAQNVIKTITDIFIAENLRQQDRETDSAINFINDQIGLYQKKLKQTEIAKMGDDLKKLLIDSTPKHPMVLELKNKIAAAKAEMEQGNYEVNESTVAGSKDELKTMKEELTQMRTELTTSSLDASDSGANRAKFASSTNEKLYKLLLLERIEKVQSRDADVTKKLYDTLLERLETAKITQRLESSKEGTRYTILDPARLPLKPKKPNKLLVMMMGIMMGAGAGIGLLFAAEAFDRSFLGVDEAKTFLEMPIFGAISKIVTHDDLKMQKLRHAKIAGVSVATGIILLIAVIFNVFIGN